jgi:phage tail sheath protein FI
MAAFPGFPPSNTISPSVRIQENDLSFYQSSPVSTYVGMVGFASKGPINQPTFITNQVQLNTIFGYPNPASGDPYLLYGASQYLLTGDSLWVVRVGETNPTNPNVAQIATVNAPSAGLAVEIVGAPPAGGIYTMDKDRFISWRLNGILSSNILHIPYTNALTGAHTYTIAQMVSLLNAQIIPEIDGIQFSENVATSSLKVSTLFSYGLTSSLEWNSIADMAVGGPSSVLGLGLGMTYATTLGTNVGYDSTGSSVIPGTYDFTGQISPSLTVYVQGTGNVNIDGVGQLIYLKYSPDNTNIGGHAVGDYYDDEVLIDDIVADINYWISNPGTTGNSLSLVGGLVAVAGPAAAPSPNVLCTTTTTTTTHAPTSTSSTTTGTSTTTTTTTAGPVGDQLQFNTLSYGSGSQIYVKPATVSTNIFGFQNISAAGSSPVGLTTSAIGYCLGLVTGAANTTNQISLSINASTPGTAGNSTTVQIANDVTEGVFNIQVFSNGVWVESWGNLTKNSSSANYVINQINLYSNYINIVDNTAVLAPPADTLNNPLLLSGGTDGMPSEPALQDDLIIGNPSTMSGLYALSEIDQVSIDLVAAPGRTSTDVVLALINFCEFVRRDCLAIIDPPFGFGAQEVIQWQNGQSYLNMVTFNSSYAALFWPWVVIYDTFNKKPVWVPPSGSVLATISRSDSLSYPWFAAAGTTRGVVPNIQDVFFRPTLAQRDAMYGNGNCINPIVQFASGNGDFYVWGNKTLQRRPTALDRVNVRRLMITVEKQVSAMARALLFEPNDETTRATFVRNATTILQSIQANRGIAADTQTSPGFFVQCDAQLNPPEVVDRNEMRAKIGIKPIKALEFFFIEFTILNQGAIVTPQGTNI